MKLTLYRHKTPMTSIFHLLLRSPSTSGLIIMQILKILEGDLPSYAVSHDHGQSGAFYPKKSWDNRYTTDGPWCQVLDSGPSSHLMQSIHCMKMEVSPPTKSGDRNNVQKSGFESTPPLNRYKMENSGSESRIRIHLSRLCIKIIKNIYKGHSRNSSKT